MNITYVSALYDIYGLSTVSDRLLRDVQDLLIHPLPLILYVDEFYANQVASFVKADTIQIIILPLADLHIYNLIVQNKDRLYLPEYRSPDKDTFEYMALMNTKIEFIYRSMSLVQTPYIGWLDAGVSKVLSHKEASFNRLVNINLVNIQTILIPGCYIRDVSFDDICRHVWWNFLGSFFICNRDYIIKFYNLSLQAIGLLLTHHRMTWEVNLWIHIMKDHPEMFIWYYALHDDSFTKLPALYNNKLDEQSQIEQPQIE